MTEVPRDYREGPARKSFTMKEKTFVSPDLDASKPDRETKILKYPGGSIHLSGTYEEIYSRFESKGFHPEVIDEILFNLFGTVASEAAISFEKILSSKNKLVGSEVRK